MAVFFVPKDRRELVKHLTEAWDETMVWSCIQGHMGQVYADSIENPRSAQFVIGDFWFFAGKPDKELAENLKWQQGKSVILVPRSREWEVLIEETYRGKADKIVRYAIKKEPSVFDRDRLKQMTENIEPGYELKMIDLELYKEAMKEEWSKDLCGNFENAGDYLERGLGAAILHRGRLVSGASSYTVYDGGIEIEIDTKREYRRRGLALKAGAKLILECLERGRYPSWDAHNRASVALAEKLGYHFDHEYTAYEVTL